MQATRTWQQQTANDPSLRRVPALPPNDWAAAAMAWGDLMAATASPQCELA